MRKPGPDPACGATYCRAYLAHSTFHPMTTAKPTLPMLVQSALEQMVGLRTGSGKYKELAGSMDMSEGVLRNKIASKKDDKRHHLTLAEAIALVRNTENYGLLTAICKEFGGQFLPVPDFRAATDADLLSNYTSMMKELGQFSSDIHLSLADGKISQTEIDGLRHDFLRLSGALGEIMDRLQMRADADQQASRLPALNGTERRC